MEHLVFGDYLGWQEKSLQNKQVSKRYGAESRRCNNGAHSRAAGSLPVAFLALPQILPGRNDLFHLMREEAEAQRGRDKSKSRELTCAGTRTPLKIRRVSVDQGGSANSLVAVAREAHS